MYTAASWVCVCAAACLSSLLVSRGSCLRLFMPVSYLMIPGFCLHAPSINAATTRTTMRSADRDIRLLIFAFMEECTSKSAGRDVRLSTFAFMEECSSKPADADVRLSTFAFMDECKKLRSIGLHPRHLRRNAPLELRVSAGAVRHPAPELSAGGVDVLAAGAPHHRLHGGIQQDFLERADGGFVRALELRPRERVERNQVHLGRQPAHQLHQLLRQRGRIVDALHQGVFEGDRAAWTVRRVTRTGVQQFGYAPALVERHQLRAQFVVGCEYTLMKGVND